MADNTNNTAVGRREKWWSVIKAVAFELKPFSLPTVEDVKAAAVAVRTNVRQVTDELVRVTPEAVGAVKAVNPLRALGLLAWLCGWALFIWLEFGAVYFIISSMAMIFMNLGERGESEWSAYSVFNAGCRALLGTINAEQFEREIMRQNVAAPAHHRGDGNEDDNHRANNNQDEDFVWVEPEPVVRDVAAGDADEPEDGNGSEFDDDEVDGGGGGGVGGGEGGAAARGAGGGRKVSGKRARRGFEERKERQEERRLALQAVEQDEWN
ncbi:unnamed protein product [Ectocarpus fasciculatus]